MNPALPSHPPPEPQFPKHCRICRAQIMPEEWARLESCGEYIDEFWKLELRHHTCGTTLSVVVEVYRDEEEE